MNPPRPWQRKQLIIVPSFQWSVVLRIMVIAVVIAVLFVWSLHYLTWRSLLQAGQTLDLTFKEQAELWLLWAAFLLGALSGSFLLLLQTTHRIAGQLSRFERALNMHLMGENTAPICTRRDDYFHELEKELNEYLTHRSQP